MFVPWKKRVHFCVGLWILPLLLPFGAHTAMAQGSADHELSPFMEVLLVEADKPESERLSRAALRTQLIDALRNDQTAPVPSVVATAEQFGDDGADGSQVALLSASPPDFESTVMKVSARQGAYAADRPLPLQSFEVVGVDPIGASQGMSLRSPFSSDAQAGLSPSVGGTYANQVGHFETVEQAACAGSHSCRRGGVQQGGACGCGEPMCCSSPLGACGQCGSLCGCDCSRPRFWARIDVLLFWLSDQTLPPLLTQSPAGTPNDVAGLLGQPTTQTLLGNDSVGNDLRVGGRFQGGFWFDACRRIGLQGDFFALDGGGESRVFTSDPTGTLARPFFNTNPDTAGPDAQIVGQPGTSEGSVRFSTSSNVISAAPTLRFNLCCCEGACSSRSTRTDFLLGYRFFRVNEEFASQEILNVTDPLFVEGTNFELNDRIRTENNFHGVEFGLSHKVQQNRWRVDLDTLFAVGEVERIVDLDGFTWIEVPGVRESRTPGGFFVGADQIGRFEDNDYAVIPQVRADISYCLGSNWRIHGGYTFLYLSSVFRPNAFINTSFDGADLGQQVTSVGRTQSPALPDTDLFLHGATIGLSYNF